LYTKNTKPIANVSSDFGLLVQVHPASKKNSEHKEETYQE
jgi:hypothetical protein